jgi:hypothetical protein
LAHVLQGRRADGQPLTRNGEPLPGKRIEGARKRFLEALGVPRSREARPDELRAILAGRTSGGFEIDAADCRRRMTDTKAPVGFIDTPTQ